MYKKSLHQYYYFE